MRIHELSLPDGEEFVHMQGLTIQRDQYFDHCSYHVQRSSLECRDAEDFASASSYSKEALLVDRARLSDQPCVQPGPGIV